MPDILYQTVIFIDLDGTLQLNPFERAIWPQVVGEMAQQSGLSAADILQMIEDENNARQRDDSVPAIMAMDLDDISLTVAKRLGVSITTSVTELVNTYAKSHSSLLEYALESLQELAAPHRAIVIATKGLAKYQLQVMDALGITPLVTDTLTPDTHNGLKKHRHFFGEWPQRAKLSIMVGDLYDDDVLYPSGHGFKTLWKPRATLIPDSLSHLDPFTRAQDFPYTPEQIVHPTGILLSLRELPAAVTHMEQHCL
ncbi:MAG: hypothetical protein ABI970_09415 [Chloroflexota bacterium]